MNITIDKQIDSNLNEDEIFITIKSKKKNSDVEKIAEVIQSYSDEYILVFDNYNMKEINMQNIYYFYRVGNYTYCKTEDKEYMVKGNLYEIEEKSNVLVRISKSYVINYTNVESFDMGESRKIKVIFPNGIKLDVSRRRLKNVIKYLERKD